MSVGERIKLIRSDIGVSQKEFGERIGISANYVSEVESGKTEPSVPVLLAIEYRFGASVEWIKTGKGSRYIKDDIKLTNEERDIIQALRESAELRKNIQLATAGFTNREAVVKKVAEVLKIPIEYAYALAVIAERLKES